MSNKLKYLPKNIIIGIIISIVNIPLSLTLASTIKESILYIGGTIGIM